MSGDYSFVYKIGEGYQVIVEFDYEPPEPVTKEHAGVPASVEVMGILAQDIDIGRSLSRECLSAIEWACHGYMRKRKSGEIQ